MVAARDKRKNSTGRGQKGTGSFVVRLATTGFAPPGAGSTEIALAQRAMKGVVAHRGAAKGLLTKWGEALDKAERSGKPVVMTVVVDPRRKAAAQIEVKDEPGSREQDDLDAALTEARQRGAVRVAEILNADDMLTADAFAKLLGATRETVHNKRRRHEVLGLEGPKRGVRFPAWQLGDDGRLLPALPRLFSAMGEQPWAVYRLLVQPHPELNGATGLDALRRNRSAEVISLAESIGAGSFA